ncbi:uncharacterized protein VP01_92g10 [Puccinia sorghi]|uniref:Uncharacterized protein n=1 Tax=Puccinia sorghi TaxID=27349 RepID=A0A0L6U946_9BASI|nr:uncharacterized protein VP01_92g10 [Puccinia sorghi]
MHNKINPCNSKAILAYDGANYQLWETALDRTLWHAFPKTSSFMSDTNNFTLLRRIESSSVASLMKNTVNKSLLGIFLKKNCSSSDRNHNIDLMSELLWLINDSSPATKLTLAKWAQLGYGLDGIHERGVVLVVRSRFAYSVNHFRVCPNIPETRGLAS